MQRGNVQYVQNENYVNVNVSVNSHKQTYKIKEELRRTESMRAFQTSAPRHVDGRPSWINDTGLIAECSLIIHDGSDSEGKSSCVCRDSVRRRTSTAATWRADSRRRCTLPPDLTDWLSFSSCCSTELTCTPRTRGERTFVTSVCRISEKEKKNLPNLRVQIWEQRA